MNIENMQPGREMDMLVAEMVMGWKRATYAQLQPNNPHYSNDRRLTLMWHSEDLKEQELAEDCGDFYQPKEAWSPSTDIAAAWVVVDKLRTLNNGDVFEFRLTFKGLAWEKPYRFRIWESDLPNVDLREFDGETAPHAICLAALKAVSK